MQFHYLVIVVAADSTISQYGPFGSRMEAIQYISNNVNKSGAMIKYVRFSVDVFGGFLYVDSGTSPS
jgi:hypothetical protein